ncbi:hypothetical protein NYR30_00460 [Gallibacterium salpingitidis]|uniref:hypothetical protein n=1 Tax=Gallibacterium salpingitidis TaxID=505341 RepID=UPI002670165A|nr:hypothetical protein [Gallibacterium salpingitidis]WKS99806.1 hypothetical protein NYR30_00460 [Gallibacterium salpingitidis]
MKVDTKDLTIYRGDDTVFTVLIDALPDFSLRDAELKMTLKSKPNIEQITLSTTDNSINVLSDNVLQLIFSHQLTKNVKSTTWHYDLQMTKNDIVRTLVRGKVIIEPDVTE